jgi:hypothetical protein
MGYFLGEEWLRKKAAESGKAIYSYQIAALMHLYLGTLTLKDISEKAGLSLDRIYSLRREPRFMHLVDVFKKEFSKELRENFLMSDYSLEEYDSLASDFTMLDEMVQMQIKVPLFAQLRELSLSLKTRTAYSLKIETYERMLFKRLFTFFIFVEKYAKTLTSKSLPDIRQIAEEILPRTDMYEIDRKLSEPRLLHTSRVKDLITKLELLFLSIPSSQL